MHFRNGNLSLIIWIRWRQKHSTLKMKIFWENVESNFFRIFEAIIEWIFFLDSQPTSRLINEMNN